MARTRRIRHGYVLASAVFAAAFAVVFANINAAVFAVVFVVVFANINAVVSAIINAAVFAIINAADFATNAVVNPVVSSFLTVTASACGEGSPLYSDGLSGAFLNNYRQGMWDE